MNLCILGDLHIRSSNPESRIDDYKEAMFEKLKFVLEAAESYKATVLLPGDVFDNPVQSNKILTETISLLQEFDLNIHVIFGQHDLWYRNKGNTALDVLIASKVVFGPTPVQEWEDKIFFYTASFGEDIPEIKTKGFNILMTHRMVVEEKLWEGQANFEWANSLLRRTKFDLIVSGDNHKRFIINSRTGTLINCGSLMRSSRDQVNHKPCFVIYDTDTRVYDVIDIPVRKQSAVFDLEKIEYEKEKNENLDAFVKGLSEEKEFGLSFVDNLNTAIINNDIAEEVKDIIQIAMKEGADGNYN